MFKKLSAVAALSLLALSAQAADYYVVVPLPGKVAPPSPIVAELNGATLPQGTVGEAYSYDMKQLLVVTGDPALDLTKATWTATSAVPPGLVLGANGVLSGTPTTASAGNTAGFPFTVSVTYKTASGQQTYALAVKVPITISVATATLTPAEVGKAYTYDLKQHLTISGDESPNAALSAWSTSATLPEGLSLSTAGVLSGTPTVKNENGQPFTVQASYKTASGSQSYTIIVNGVALEVAKIAGGYDFTCAITAAGGVKCWGSNSYGQLGNGTTNSSSTPVAVTGLSSGVKDIAAGRYHVCAITSAGAAKCWGYNGNNQVGDGTSTNRTTPVTVSGLSSGVSKISLGWYHSCVITSAGAAQCWGDGNNGKLGNGTTTAKSVPTQVSGLTSGVVSISGGYEHTCAALSSGGVRCWGYNNRGQLGNGNSTASSVPVTVSGLTNAISADTGDEFSCALTQAGGVKCWGGNSAGQLGNSTNTSSYAPVNVTGLSSGVARMDAWNGHVCVVTTAGAAKCWGYNSYGQVGNGTTGHKNAPVDVSGLSSGVVGVSTGGGHVCAILTDSTVKCWGWNSQGQLGDGTAVTRYTPVSVGSF